MEITEIKNKLATLSISELNEIIEGINNKAHDELTKQDEITYNLIWEILR